MSTTEWIGVSLFVLAGLLLLWLGDIFDRLAKKKNLAVSDAFLAAFKQDGVIPNYCPRCGIQHCGYYVIQNHAKGTVSLWSRREGRRLLEIPEVDLRCSEVAVFTEYDWCYNFRFKDRTLSFRKTVLERFGPGYCVQLVVQDDEVAGKRQININGVTVIIDESLVSRLIEGDTLHIIDNFDAKSITI